MWAAATAVPVRCVLLQELEGLLAAFDEERGVMAERYAAVEGRATQLQAQVRNYTARFSPCLFAAGCCPPPTSLR